MACKAAWNVASIRTQWSMSPSTDCFNVWSTAVYTLTWFDEDQIKADINIEMALLKISCAVVKKESFVCLECAIYCVKICS